VRFHLSLNVSDLPKAVSYFQKVLGVPVAKHRADYAKFELENPPVVFSLEQRSPRQYGSLNHLGFRYPDSAALVDVQRQMEQQGISSQREEGVECCYARQTKFWVHDLDQRLWEFYTLEEDLDHRGAGQSLEQMVGDEAADLINLNYSTITYEHRLGSPFELPTEPCDEINLRGTFNVPYSVAEIETCFQQCMTALKPGGKLLMHILTCEEALCSPPELPGPVAHVKHVPVRLDLMTALESTGFTDIKLTTFRSGACFEYKGHPLRETKLECQKPTVSDNNECTVVYKGPFKQITDDEGNVFQRGQHTLISSHRWASMKASSMSEMFVELPEVAPVSQCLS
jgi:catechol 2,3-dioxygenase-like lactoylglutathione lyase family enzyme